MRRVRGFWYHWLYWNNGKENGNHYSILSLYWDNVKENGNHYSLLGLYWDNVKENGNHYSLLGLYWDNVKENGNHYSILGSYWEHGKENGNYYILVVFVRFASGSKGHGHCVSRLIMVIIGVIIWLIRVINLLTKSP